MNQKNCSVIKYTSCPPTCRAIHQLHTSKVLWLHYLLQTDQASLIKVHSWPRLLHMTKCSVEDTPWWKISHQQPSFSLSSSLPILPIPLSLLPSLFSPSFFSLSAFLVPLSSFFPYLPGPPTIHPPLIPPTSLAYAYHVFFEYNRGHFSQDRRRCLNQVEAGCLGRNPYLSLLNYQIQLHQILDEKTKKKTKIGGGNRKWRREGVYRKKEREGGRKGER